MSESNLRVVRDWYATRDRKRLITEEVVHEIPAGFPHGGTYVGQEAAFDPGGFFPRLSADFPDWRADVEQILDAGDLVLSLGRYHAHAAGNGAPVDAPFVHLWRVRNGQIVGFATHTDTLVVDRALHPAGRGRAE